MTEDIQVIAGECTTTFEGTRERERRGRVVVVVKPDKFHNQFYYSTHNHHQPAVHPR